MSFSIISCIIKFNPFHQFSSHKIIDRSNLITVNLFVRQFQIMNQHRNSAQTVDTLKHRCIIFMVDEIIRVSGGRTNSPTDKLSLPPSLIKDIDTTYQWRRDLSVLLHWPPCDRYARISRTPPFSDQYRLTNENKLDRRATAEAQLDNFDPTIASSPASIQFAFALAATYCLQKHIRLLSPYYNAPDHMSPMLAYWIAVVGALPNMNNPTTYLLDIHPRQQGSSDFWLAVIKSFWYIVAQNGVGYFFDWCRNALGYSIEFQHKTCVEFLWTRHTDDMRNSLVNYSTPGNYALLKLIVRANETGILVEILDQFGYEANARRAKILRIIENISCDDFINGGYNLEMFEYLLDCLIANCSDIPSKIAGSLCKILSPIWDYLTTEKRAQIANDFVALLRYAIELGYVELAMRIWIEEKHVSRRFKMLFRDECAVFRTSCANGYLEMVRSFMEWLWTDQRCYMIVSKSNDAWNSAARNGHSSILRYLWEHMDPRTSDQSVFSDVISRESLYQLIIAESNKYDDGGSHELEDFLLVLITTPSSGREPIHPPAVMKDLLINVLLLDNEKALKILVKRAKGTGDPSSLRTLVGEFTDDQRARLYSKLATQDDVKLCGLESVPVVTRLRAMSVQPVCEREDSDEDEEDEESGGEVIDLCDEYYEG